MPSDETSSQSIHTLTNRSDLINNQQNTTSSRSYIQFGRYGIDNQCPICLSSEARLPVETNCGHLFCGVCIIKYWKHGDFVTAMPCPFCRQSVSVLLPCFRHDMIKVDQQHSSSSTSSSSSSSSSSPSTSSENRSRFSLLNGIRSRTTTTATTTLTSSSSTFKPFDTLNENSAEEPTIPQLIHEINDYNRRFSGSRPWIDYLWDLPILLRHLSIEFFTGGLVYFFRIRIILCFLTGIMYLISPLDMIPEAFYGLFGFLDDIFVIIVIAVYLTVVYRSVLAERWANE